jgi:peptidoglycan/LPS O-acetylase OafA/YrhL
MILSPLLLQGWFGPIATFLNTPAWTMSAEAFYYFLFPWMAKWKKPSSMKSHLWKMAGVWMLGLAPGVLYMVLSPDGIAHPDRWTVAPWLRMLKYTPLPHFPSFIFGVLLADLDRMVDRTSRLRLILGIFGFAAIFFLLRLGGVVPYAIIHDGLLMPLFACVVLGLAGNNWLSNAIGCRPLVFIGEGSYCLYLLHFNLWNLVHQSGILQATGLIRFDPWISYALLIALALCCMYWIEKPAQKVLRGWLHLWR